MTIIQYIIKFLLSMIGLILVVGVLVFFCMVFFRENTVYAIEYFLNLFGEPNILIANQNMIEIGGAL